MTLKELRLSKKITQKEAAELTGISLRSYKQYENDESKVNSIKYKYLVDEISKVGFIDEEHGVLEIEDIRNIVETVFHSLEVDYCYLFGSYSRGEATEKSDVDLLVATSITGMKFYGLVERLRQALKKKVDLLNIEQLLDNKELLNDILKDGIKIYEKGRYILPSKNN